MKVWGSIFNLIAVVIIAIMLIIFNNIEETNSRQFEELRLAQAVDYAVEGAFRSAIATDTIGTDYTNGGMEEVQINPTQVMDTFYNIMCISYDMSNSPENKAKIEQSVATAVLCGIDGYYILESVEVDNDPYDPVVGGEYALSWGIKRPYIVRSDYGRVYAANLVNEKTIEYTKDSKLMYRSSYGEENVDGDGITDLGAGDVGRAKVNQEISKLITEDINYAIHSRNINSTEEKMKSFYVPSADTMTSVNQIKSPSLILLFQDSTFLNGYNLNVTSVGGARVKVRSNVLGFTQAGHGSDKYYCYAGQQLGEPGITVVERFDTLHEAAEAGYKPHLVFLKKPSFGKLKSANQITEDNKSN